MAGRGGKHDEILAARIATGATLADAARDANCSLRTAERRAADPAFRRKVAGIRARMLDQVTGEFAASLTCAVAELRRLLEHAESEQARLGAARTLIEHALRLREHGEFEQRLLELEKGKDEGLRAVPAEEDEPGDAA